MSQQLQIEVPIERHTGDNYEAAMAEYLKLDHARKDANIFLCYYTGDRKYFVSRYCSKSFIETKYPNIKIVQ